MAEEGLWRGAAGRGAAGDLEEPGRGLREAWEMRLRKMLEWRLTRGLSKLSAGEDDSEKLEGERQPLEEEALVLPLRQRSRCLNLGMVGQWSSLGVDRRRGGGEFQRADEIAFRPEQNGLWEKCKPG